MIFKFKLFKYNDLSDKIVLYIQYSKQNLNHNKNDPEKWSTEEKTLIDKTNEFIFCQCLSKKTQLFLYMLYLLTI